MTEDHGISRRLLLGQLLSLGVLAPAISAQNQAEDDPLRSLRPAHPRLIILDSDLERVRQMARDNPLAHRVYTDLERECERLLTVPPSEYKLIGTRLLVQVRQIVTRVTTLAFFYRLTAHEPYLRRAVAELRAAASFHDWNPLALYRNR